MWKIKVVMCFDYDLHEILVYMYHVREREREGAGVKNLENS